MGNHRLCRIIYTGLYNFELTFDTNCLDKNPIFQFGTIKSIKIPSFLISNKFIEWYRLKKWKTRIWCLQEKKECHLEISMTILKELQIRKLT